MSRPTTRAKPRTLFLVAGILAALVAAPLWAGQGNADNPKVLPPGSTPFGKSYAQWHVAWWNWAMSIPAPINPLLNADDPGDQTTSALPVWIGPYEASTDQSGHVWFLAETFRNGWVVERDATIPAGTTLCFPIQNHMLFGWPNLPQAEAWMRSYLRLVLDTADVRCEIDGVPVNNPDRYRCQSPAVPMILGEENLPGIPPGPHGMMVDDGYYLILAPLSVGRHTIHWTSRMEMIPYWNPWDQPPSPPYPPAVQEVTYHITVVPNSQ
jgi:hypothetical protein